MKKTQDKQADKQTKQPNYPKVHTQAHPNAYKVPIADLLNPDCPISAGVTDKLRKELLELQAKGRKYAYIDSYRIEYKDIADPTKPASKAVNETARQNIKKAVEERGIKNAAIYDNDIALDPDNPISTISLPEELRKNLEVTRFIYKSLIRVLSEEKINFIFDKAATFWEALAAELQKIQKTQNETITGLIELCLDENGKPKPDNILEKAITAAGFYTTEESREQLPEAMSSKIEILDMPIDNLSAITFSRLKTDKKAKKFKVTPGQLSFDFVGFNDAQYITDNIENFETYKINVAHRGEDPALIIYGICFANLPGVTITKELTEYDKRVYIAMCGLTAAGWSQCRSYNFCVTINQIAYLMGLTHNPSTTDKKKINDSITKLNATHIFIENYYESQVHKSREHKTYDGSFLPMERITTTLNGQTITAIHPFRDAPMFAFAKARKQVTTIKREWLAVPANQNETQLGLQHYFIEWISQLKNQHNNSKNPEISYKRLCEIVNVTDRKGKERLPEKVKIILDHYKNTGFINDYTETEMQTGKGIRLTV